MGLLRDFKYVWKFCIRYFVPMWLINVQLFKQIFQIVDLDEVMIMISPNSRAPKGAKERGEMKWEYGGSSGEDQEVECRKWRNGATQLEICCTMYKRS